MGTAGAAHGQTIHIPQRKSQASPFDSASRSIGFAIVPFEFRRPKARSHQDLLDVDSALNWGLAEMTESPTDCPRCVPVSCRLPRKEATRQRPATKGSSVHRVRAISRVGPSGTMEVERGRRAPTRREKGAESSPYFK